MPTKIEWTEETWNPMTGCDKVSPGCDNCYAVVMARRLQNAPNKKVRAAYEGTVEGDDWTGVVHFLEERLIDPVNRSKPKMFFVNSMSDIFHKGFSEEQIDLVFGAMAACHLLERGHVFQVLTKRSGRMRAYLSSDERARRVLDAARHVLRHHADNAAVWFDTHETFAAKHWPLPNVWMGVSVENQKCAQRLDALVNAPAAVRWVSAEPLLGPLDLTQWIYDKEKVAQASTGGPMAMNIHQARAACPPCRIDWLVAGGESGTHARPSHPDWLVSLRDQCADAGVAFFFKQWGRFANGSVRGKSGMVVLNDGRMCEPHKVEPLAREINRGSELNWHRLHPTIMTPVGKKKAGRELDGVIHNHYPEDI